MQNIASPPQANAEVVINENFVSVKPASLYGIRQPVTTGLTWGYWGGQFNGNTVADGTVALTASNTNYIVANRSTGAVTAATNTTNWDNDTTYLRLYSVVAGASSITSYVDFRQAYGGGGGGGGTVDSIVAGTGISVDDTDPANPIVSATGGGGGGDVSGPGVSVDNTLARWDGTSGELLQGSGVVVSDADEISAYKANINTQTGTSYSLQASDSGKIVELTNGAAIALTAPNSMPKGFNCTIVQGGAGAVTVASSGSGTVVNRQSQFKTAGQNAMCVLYVRSNSGTDAVFVFGGDTAA